MTAIDIYKALQARYSEQRGWLLIKELRSGTGFGEGKEQRVDAWAIQLFNMAISSDGKRINIPNYRIAFEIKVSRADALAELKNPDKRWFAYSISHEFYFVTAPGIIEPEELDEYDGLMELRGIALVVVRKAKVRPTMLPKWNFVASICRRIIRIEQLGGSNV